MKAYKFLISVMLCVLIAFGFGSAYASLTKVIVKDFSVNVNSIEETDTLQVAEFLNDKAENGKYVVFDITAKNPSLQERQFALFSFEMSVDGKHYKPSITMDNKDVLVVDVVGPQESRKTHLYFDVPADTALDEAELLYNGQEVWNREEV